MKLFKFKYTSTGARGTYNNEAYFSNKTVLDKLLKEWERLGRGNYQYFTSEDDKAFNKQAKVEILNECDVFCIGSQMAFYGIQYHDHMYVK